MKALLILPFLALPAAAQEAETTPSPLEQGIRQFMQGLLADMEPALRDLEMLAEGALPLLEGLERFDPSLYHAPEILENGDILIRRRDPAEVAPEDVAPNPDGSIDL
jgi:hypothetical protein